MYRSDCPHCDTPLGITEDLIGQDVECGNCGRIFSAAPDTESPEADDGGPERDTDDRQSRNRQRQRSNDYATLSLVLGMATIPLFIGCWMLVIPTAIAGILCGVPGLKSPKYKTQAVAGIVVSALSFLVAVGLSIVMIIVLVAING